MIKRLLSVVLAFFMVSCMDSRENKLQRFLIQGNDMAGKQSFGEAKRYYREAIKMDSCFVDAWNNLGTVYYKEKHFAEALDAYTNALQCDPKMRLALLNRSNTFYELNKPEQALSDINAFSALGADTLVTHLSRGLIFTRKQEFNPAVSSFKRALQMDGNHVETLVNLGTVYYYRKQYDSAKYFLDRAIENNPREPNAYNAYALVELENGNAGEALRRVNEALALRSNDPYFLNNRGYILITLNELDKALTDIDKSIGEDPYNAWAYRNKGIYYLRTNQSESALRVLTQALKIDTTVSKLYYYLGEAYFMNQDVQKGCSFFLKAEARGDLTEKAIPSKCKR
jgi:tetratricopeptide (TPR) repeat protein